MSKVEINQRKREEAITDVIESTALERAALAELINAGACEMRGVMNLEDNSLDKLVRFQESLDLILKDSIRMQELLEDDVQSIKTETSLEVNEVLNVEEEITETVDDGGEKRIVKRIKRSKE